MGNKLISKNEEDILKNNQNCLSRINIGTAAYNEAKTLQSTLSYLEKSLKNLRFESNPKIIICLNGCNDNTEEILLKIKKTYSFPIRILYSRKGKLRAHKEIVENIKNNNPILFIDADTLVPSATIRSLLWELERDKNISIISAYPYILKPKGLSLFSNLMLHILNIKRIYPKIEIAKEDVSEFHPNAKNEFEKRSRVYFHGRCFLIRNKGIYKFPKKNSKIRGDDSFLSFSILTEKPKGSIKVLFDSPVYSHPTLSLKEYLKTWYRIRKDLDHIYEEYPEFKELKNKTEMKFNWRYILKELPIKYKVYSIVFSIVRRFEIYSYKVIKNKINLDVIWKYEKKGI